MDPLAPIGRNETCWCGSELKYKYCHGDKRPPSRPGAPVPADKPGSRFISPTVSVDIEVLTTSMPAGTPITLPGPEPEPHSIPYTSWEHELPRALLDPSDPLDPAALGRLRVEVLRRLARTRRAADRQPNNEVLEAVYRLSAETIKTVDALSRVEPRATMLWNEELDVAAFMGRTLLLADHILLADGIFGAMLRGADMGGVRRAAKEQLEYAELIASGLAIPVPAGVAMAHRGPAVQQLTAHDLANDELSAWVRDQLIFEGPTAREVLFVTAGDDLSRRPMNFWMHGRFMPNSLDDETGHFMLGMLLDYDADYDYSPWIHQVRDSATALYVQRTNQRIVTADVFAAEYVSASMFEARLLHRRGTTSHTAAQAAVWADVPLLTSLTSPELAKILCHEQAVADLRDRVRVSLVTARTPGDQVDALTELAHEVEAYSHKLTRNMSSDRFWQSASPAGLGAAGLLIGGFAGGIPGLVAGGLSALAGLTPYLGTRLNDRRDAAYLFVAARRAPR